MNPEPRARTTLPWGWCAALATFALCVLVAEPPPAHAHALLDRSDPPPGVTIPTDRPPHRISLWFTEPVQVAFNGVAVLDSSDRRVERLNARVVRGDATRVEVDLGDLPQGAYLVRWHVTSADNHVVRGSYWFVVGFAATPPRAAALLGASAPPIPPLEVAARWLGLVGLSILAGAPLFQLIVLGLLATRLSPPLFLEPIRRARAVWLAATGTFVLAQLLLAAAQTEAVAELPLPQAWDHAVLRVVFFDSRFAALRWTRLLLGLALGGLLVSQASRHREPAGTPVTTRLAAGLGLLLILSTSLSGHAVGARISPPLAIGIDAVHLAAAALWLGGLVELSLLLPSLLTLASAEHRSNLLRALVPSVSRAALASALVLIATGIFNAWEHAASLKAVAATAYGQSLLLKMALLLPLLGIAAINLLIIRPRVAAGQAATDAGLPRRFRALVLAEVLVGAVVLLAVGLLGNLPPSGQQSLPAPVAVARQVGDLRVAFAIDPNWVGVSRFRVTLADTQGLPPADVRHVILTFTMEGMNMGRTNVTMKPRGEGVYEAEGFYVGMPGISQIGVAVARAGGADRNAVFRIEVPDLNQKQFAGLRASLGMGPEELSGNPAAADATSRARGREAYGRQCPMCHGMSGIGDGPASASLLPPPADLTLHARWHADEQLYWFITHGVSGTSMLGFADRLSTGERWNIINYLHELAAAPTATASRRAPVAPPPATPAAPGAPALTGPSSVASTPLAVANPVGRLVFGPDYDSNLWLLRLPDGKPEQLTSFGPPEFSSNPAWKDLRRLTTQPGHRGLDWTRASR